MALLLIMRFHAPNFPSAQFVLYFGSYGSQQSQDEGLC